MPSDAQRCAALITARERPGRRRGRVRWIDDGVTVAVEAHGRPDGPVRDPVLRSFSIAT